MSIADKMLQLKQDIDDAYQAGYDKGVSEGGGNSGDSWYDTFWDAIQQNGDRRDYQYAFTGTMGWTDEIFKPKYKFINTTGVYGFSYMFQKHKGITKVTKDMFDLDNSISGYYAVYMFDSAEIKEVEYDLRKASSVQRLFQNFKGESVTLHNYAHTYDATFGGATNLKHLRWINSSIPTTSKGFSLESCTLLDKESIIGTVNILKEYTDGRTSTLYLSRTAVMNAFNIEEDAETGEFLPSEGLDEWNILISPKLTNWTISLK